MARVRTDSTNIEIIYRPFPVNASSTVSIFATTEWKPEDRLDVRATTMTIQIDQSIGDPLVSNLLSLQSTAQLFIENRFSLRSQTLTTNPLISLTVGYLFQNRLESPFTLNVRARALWEPAAFNGRAGNQNRIRTQLDTATANVSHTNSVATPLTNISNFLLAGFEAVLADGGDTLVLGGFNTDPGIAVPDVSALLAGADIRDFIV